MDVTDETAEELPRVRTRTGRASRRRALKNAPCELCDRPMTAKDRMVIRVPDPRRENWGVMAQALAHPRCVAKAERHRAEAAERAFATVSSAAKAQQADVQTTDRVTAAGLWLPNR